MIGIILAAGAGTRLGNDKPKCLTEVGRYTILQRQIAEMNRVGISSIHVVIGYQHNVIREFISDDPFLSNLDLRFTFDKNIRYLDTNTARSLEIALRSCREKEEPVVFFNGDVVFEDGILTGLLNENHYREKKIVVFAQTKECGEEEIKIVTDGQGGVISIGKYIEPKKAEGEGIGINFIPFSLIDTVIDELERCGDNDFFEKAFDRLTDDSLLKAFDIGDMFAIEIDFAEDLRQARDWARSLKDERSLR